MKNNNQKKFRFLAIIIIMIVFSIFIYSIIPFICYIFGYDFIDTFSNKFYLIHMIPVLFVFNLMFTTHIDKDFFIIK